MRAAFFVLVAVAACRSQATPAAAQPAPPTPAAPTAPPFARALAGPYADVAAFCATKPSNPDDLGCAIVESPKIDGAPKPPLREVAIVYVPIADAPYRGCAIALRTERGWFVSAGSDEICHDRSHVEPRQIRVSTEGDVTVVEVMVEHHTNHAETLAEYTVAAFCGARNDAPACSPWIVSRCEPQQSMSMCGDTRFEATWTIDGNTVTLAALPADARVANGAHGLF